MGDRSFGERMSPFCVRNINLRSKFKSSGSDV